MKHPCLFALALATALATALCAQDQPPPGKEGGGKDEVKKGDKADKARDIIANVAKNMKAAEERLQQKDPGDVTRKIQRDIIDDLDELIKQNAKSAGGGSSKKSSKDQGGSKDGKKDNQNKKDQGGKDQQPGGKDGQQDSKMGDDGDNQTGKAKGREDGPQGQEKGQGDKGDGKDENKKPGKGKGGGEAKDPKGGKDDAKGQAKDEGDPENGKNGGQGLAKLHKDASKKLDAAADVNRSPWGHLPETKRLEMDAYSKERFMPRYEELLQQYYRAIAEQGSKKE
jgi:hypothetical protein